MNLSNHMNNYVQSMQPNQLFDFDQKISDIPGIINLTFGEPDFPTPEHIKKAAIRAIENDDSHYTDPRGMETLRVTAANYLKQQYHLNYDPDTQITVTVGVSEGIHDVFLSILNPGDEVVVPTPSYPLYMPNISVTGAKLVFVNTEQDDYKLTPQRLERTLEEHPKAKALLLNYPNNPIGNTYSKDELKALGSVIKKHPIFCVCDEIYSELTYDCKHCSLAPFIPDQAIVMNGVSKAFAMTGWRVGLVCGPQEIIKRINAIHSDIVTSVNTNAQYAAVEAFKNGKPDSLRMRKIYQQRRDILRKGIAEVGFTSPKPSGAFYIFAKIPSEFTQDSVKFAYQLAKEAKVGSIPGVVFGPGGEGHIRFSYAASTASLREVVKRIQKFVKDFQQSHQTV